MLCVQPLLSRHHHRPTTTLCNTPVWPGNTICFGHLRNATSFVDDDIHLITPYLFLTSVRNAHNVAKLREMRITHIVTLMNNHLPDWVLLPLQNVGVKHIWIALVDVAEDDRFMPAMQECHEYIQQYKSEPDARILVHCTVGVSRSPCAVIYHLMQQSPAHNVQMCLRQVRASRRFINPNPAFLKQLEQFDKDRQQTTPVTINTL
jgi:predicted protein tyrosine phosphatase